MSRFTQIVGLTNKATSFVADFKEVKSDSFTSGMFDEKIPLRKWKHPEIGFVREILQDSPWSSGPMLFYCLEWDYGNGAKFQIFQWVVDPTVKTELDYEKGTYWV